MKLISMTDYVLDEIKPFESADLMDELQTKARILERIGDYSIFLKQPLILGMFVPCDKEGNVLNEVKHKRVDEFSDDSWQKHQAELRQYKQAEERVLFEGFELWYYDDKPHALDHANCCVTLSDNNNIESLIESDVYLTTTGLKQTGL